MELWELEDELLQAIDLFSGPLSLPGPIQDEIAGIVAVSGRGVPVGRLRDLLNQIRLEAMTHEDHEIDGFNPSFALDDFGLDDPGFGSLEPASDVAACSGQPDAPTLATAGPPRRGVPEARRRIRGAVPLCAAGQLGLALGG